MKIPQSDMPEEALWQNFFDAEGLMQTLIPDAPLPGDAIEIGAGYGTFTASALNSITGNLHSYEIESQLCSELEYRFQNSLDTRLQVHCQDVLAKDIELNANSIVMATAFNLLHFGDPQTLLKNLYQVLAPAGRLLIIHWRNDIETPRGPDIELRPTAEKIYDWCRNAGFEALQKPDISVSCPWHFAVVATK